VPQRDMSAEDVVAIVRRLQRAGLAVWLDGGWGIDALVRRQTRPHDDLDVVVRSEDVPAVERELAALGYQRAGGGIWHYPLGGLAGKGAVAGQRVDCLTAETQVICHGGYELDEDDLHDLRLLRCGERLRRRASTHVGDGVFHESLPPAIIDFAPYYRPPQYASAIVVADALCWEEAPAELADAVDRQYLLRALIYRAVTSFEFGGDAERELEVAFSLAA
jgi:lincosamide nucleotidyltransferase A/C/D/E